MKRQPRAKAILPGIRDMISLAATSSDEKRETLAKDLLKNIKNKYPKEIPPVEETIIKLISKARNHKLSSLDKPWNLAVLNRLHELGIFDDFNADAIYYIQKVQYYMDNVRFRNWDLDFLEYLNQGIKDHKIDASEVTDNVISKAQSERPILTIRQARWITRLYRLQNEDIERLYLASLFYSDNEIISEISKSPYDTTILDHALYNWPDFQQLIDNRMENTGFISCKPYLRHFKSE